MDWMLFRLNGVSHAYWQEYRLLTSSEKEKLEDYACTSGSLFWEENGAISHLLCDIGFGVWQSLVDFQLFGKDVFSKSTISSARLAGILITHSHLDHIGELVIFIESWNRLHGFLEPVQLYITQSTFDRIQIAYPWILGKKRDKDQLNVNIISPNQLFSVGQVKILPIDASSHCRGGVNFLIDLAGCQIFLGWDINESPEPGEIDWGRVDLAFLDGNTIEDHPTGHWSIKKMLTWAKRVGLRRINIVHYSGWEDGKVLTYIERSKILQELNPGQKFSIMFGSQGQEYQWKERELKWWRKEVKRWS